MDCEICGKPYGHCEWDVHTAKLVAQSPSARFSATETVETQWFKFSVSPRLSETYTNKAGITVALVAAVIDIAE